MLVLDRGFVDPFTADDLELTTVVGYQAALAIERARFLAAVPRASRSSGAGCSRHFSPDVADAGPGRRSSSTRTRSTPQVRDDVTVLFADVQGFAGLTERLPPLELAALLRDYFRAMTEALFEEKGTLDKFIGDGVMAVFGAPVPSPTAPIRALRCAWRMLRRSRS